MDISFRKINLFLIDCSLSVFSLYCAYLLRYNWSLTSSELLDYFSMLPFILLCRPAAYCCFGFYSRVWKYGSLEDMIQIIKAVVAGSALILVASFIYNRAIFFPRSVLIIDVITLTLLIGSSRVVWRLFQEKVRRNKPSETNPATKTLVYGAGNIASHLLKSLRLESHKYNICGMIDDDPKKHKLTIMGVKILGNRKTIPDLVKDLGIELIIIAINRLDSENLRQIVDACQKAGVRYKLISSTVDMNTNEIHISKIRNIEISDLLGRETVYLDFTSIKTMVKGSRILVTGGGGSIGSELCRHILEYEPEFLIVLDNSENYLYELMNLLNRESIKTQVRFIFGSVTNKQKIDAIFTRYGPQFVFHAAAHKHVPMMEPHPDEAVINNVHGTKIVADAAHRFNAEKFILISTDKAVKPTSVMGMTKRLGELYIQHINKKSQTRFMAVRFGNVIGSKGSVVPLFQKQIEAGGPVTITHPDMTRYFMLISEAVSLVLQAAAFGKEGELFMLEMGKPVKIIDLARQMIRLANYEPGKDIQIETTGIREGEKLAEELMDETDRVLSTNHEKIKIIQQDPIYDPDFETKFNEICQKAFQGKTEGIKTELLEIISPKQRMTGISK